MKMNLYVVYDKVGEESLPVWESRNDGCALRAFQKAILGEQSLLVNEMKLLCIGTIDHDTSIIEPVTPAREVIAVLSHAKDTEEEDAESI